MLHVGQTDEFSSELGFLCAKCEDYTHHGDRCAQYLFHNRMCSIIGLLHYLFTFECGLRFAAYLRAPPPREPDELPPRLLPPDEELPDEERLLLPE